MDNMLRAESVVLIAIIAAGVFLIAALFAELKKPLIVAALTDVGATEIDVSWRPFSFDESNDVYEVTYVDNEGHRRHVMCKVSAGILGSKRLFWSETPR
jgi:hypothetical protein